MFCGEQWGRVGTAMQREELNGRHECTLDDRSRLAIPAKLRWAFPHGAVVAPWFDPCLIVVPRHRWAEKLREIFGGELNPLNDDERRLRRLIIGQLAEQESLDKQGRILVPAGLRQRAGLDGKVSVLGQVDYLELWDPGRLDQDFDEMDKEGVSEIGRRLVEAGR